MPYQGMNSGMRRVLMSVPLSPHVCSVIPLCLFCQPLYIDEKPRLRSIFFTAVACLLHDCGKGVPQPCAHDKPKGFSRQTTVQNTTEAYVTHNGSLCKRQESPVRCAKKPFLPSRVKTAQVNNT